MFPESDDEFAVIVDKAMKGSDGYAVKVRDLLAAPGVIDRTIAALDAVVVRIDAQLDEWVGGERVRSRERVRECMYDWLVWYEMLKRMQAADG